MHRRRRHHEYAEAWMWALVFAALAGTRKASASVPTAPVPPSPVPRTPASTASGVGKVNTGGPTWKADRLAELARRGYSGDVALSILAQWGFETAFGKGEWNYNVGNIIWTAGYVPVDIGPQISRAYTSLAAGVADWLALVQSPRYAQAWTSLQVAPLDSSWARELAAAGYATADPVAYENGYKAARARV
jgi:hypothetical protein